MNPYYEAIAETGSEVGEIDTPTTGTITCSTPTMDNADSPAALRSLYARGTRSALFKVDLASNLAGYTYEGSYGRHVTFFWQSVPNGYQTDITRNSPSGRSASIYQSTFRKTDPGWTLVGRPILVAENAKRQSPLAAVTWANGLKGAVYYLDERNLICEQVTRDGGEQWCAGLLTEQTIPTQSNSDLAAMVTWESLHSRRIFVYYQDEANRIRELRFAAEEDEWYEDSPCSAHLLEALGGTSLACAAEPECSGARSVYSQSTTRGVQEHYYSVRRNKWTSEGGNEMQQRFDRKVRLGYCTDRWYARAYAHDVTKVLESSWQRGYDCKWRDVAILPMSTGTAKIKENFIVLCWPQDVDNTMSEIHLFSTEGGILHDYLIGPATGGEFPLVEDF